MKNLDIFRSPKGCKKSDCFSTDKEQAKYPIATLLALVWQFRWLGKPESLKAHNFRIHGHERLCVLTGGQIHHGENAQCNRRCADGRLEAIVCPGQVTCGSQGYGDDYRK